jgi:archaellum component FlaC
MSALLEVADELYALTLAEFTPVRDARAKELKSADAELSKQVRALRKPSVAAWVVNLLVRHEPEQVEQVLAVGAALREAQASLAGEELRALTRQRRQLTAAVTTQARAVAREQGTRVTDSVAEQVEATLTAAMVSEECARAVRSGLLVAALATTGVDDVDVAAALAAPEALGFSATPRETEAEPAGRPELHVVPDPEADRKALAAAQAALAAAESELAGADEALAEAARDVETLEARAMQVQAQIDELRTKIAELEETYEQVDDELGDAEDVRAEAEGARTEAARARDTAAAAVEKLTR